MKSILGGPTFFLASFLVMAGSVAPCLAQPANTPPAAIGAGAPVTSDGDAPIPASAFASRSAFQSARLSPDGKRIALESNNNDGTSIALFDADSLYFLKKININPAQQLEWFSWAGNGRVLFSISEPGEWFGTTIRYTRMFCYDVASDTVSKVGWNTEGPVGDDVLYVDPEGAFVLLSAQKTIYDYPAVWRYQLAPSKRADHGVKVQAPRIGIWDWFADDSGTVRMGFQPITGGKLKIWYRPDPATPLKVIARLGREEDDDRVWDVVRIVSGSDDGYVIEKVEDRRVLRRFNYATRTSGEIVYRNADWDLTSASIGDDGKPVAAYYVDDKQRIVWFDEAMKTVQARLEKAMKDMDVRVISRARDDSRMLVYVGREDDPGSLYIFTKATRTLKFFGNYRPDLTGHSLSRPAAVQYPARDGTKIHAYLTLPAAKTAKPAKGLPLVILPHGGPYGVRDTLSYDDEVQFLASRGYAVLQPNYRGSEGYGEAFEKLGKGQIGRTMQDDLDDGMDWLVKQGIADPARVCVVGSSYGGYAALWAVIRNPERYRCAASFAGVTDWETQLRYDNRFFDKKGRKEWQSWTMGDETTFDFASVSPARQAARLTRPVLLAHGDKDSNVPFSQYKTMRDAAAKAGVPLEPLVFEGEGHGFAKSESEQRWYEALGAFLARHNPAR